MKEYINAKTILFLVALIIFGGYMIILIALMVLIKYLPKILKRNYIKIKYGTNPRHRGRF